MASHLLNDPEHWHERAKAMRLLSVKTPEPVSRWAILKVADEYEVLAQRAEDRINHRPQEPLKQ